jgi:exonuclease RecJ (EC 3.1.-.-)
MVQKRWNLLHTDESKVQKLQTELNISAVLCRLLVNRGIETYDQAYQFFRSDKKQLHDPFLMKGMKNAILRLHQAISHQEKILLYGDYDVDGTTAVAVVYQYLKKLTTNIDFYIPHRFKEGYGVSQEGIQYAVDQEVKLLITLDCGIKSTDHIAYAKSKGIDTIICDHHMPDDELPDAFAILNPKQNDCPYPYKELCGCGIGYKLISAYSQQYHVLLDEKNDYIDLVATAIAADIVPITDENRTLCVMGLKKANTKPSMPLRTLKIISGFNKEFTISDLVFIIAPRVNAVGRMDDARKAVELFIEEDEQKAIVLATELHQVNNDRREVDKQITEEALAQARIQNSQQSLSSTVVYNQHWHKGVVGIVASRLIEHYYRPTIVLTQSNGKITGSARSIKGFNLFDGLNQCAEYLDAYGGHYFAAGLTLSEENLEGFKKRFNEVVENTLDATQFLPEIEIDAELEFHQIDTKFINILRQFAPHGPQNMKPVFITRNVTDHQGLTQLVKEKHIRFIIKQTNQKIMQGIGFNMKDKLNIVKSQQPFEILYQLEENNWNGHTTIQLKVLDIM